MSKQSNTLARAHDHKKRQAFVYEALCEPLIPVLAKVASEYDDYEDTIYSTGFAFAAKLTNGHVVTWGSAGDGGDSSSVQAELTAVDTIYSTDGAFAAKLTNGHVVTWGDANLGGDSSSVQAELTAV